MELSKRVVDVGGSYGEGLWEFDDDCGRMSVANPGLQDSPE